MRLIDEGAVLVADDRSVLLSDSDTIVARAPNKLSGLLEVRSIGVVRVAAQATAQLAQTVDLGAAVERHPNPKFATFLGVSIPLLRMHAFEAATPAKIRLAVQGGADNIAR